VSISQQIKEAIRESGKTVNQIAVESGVAQPILSRFLSDDDSQHRDIRLETTADKLAAYLGLELRPVKETPAKKKKTR